MIFFSKESKSDFFSLRGGGGSEGKGGLASVNELFTRNPKFWGMGGRGKKGVGG